MDLLTHLFLPLALVYGARMNGIENRTLLLLSFFTILPDGDVFLGVHRGIFSHIALDFISGGIPFLYPLSSVGVGMEFPLLLRFGSFPTVVEWLPRLVINTPPTAMHGQVLDVFSSFGVASVALFLIIYSRRSRRRR